MAINYQDLCRTGIEFSGTDELKEMFCALAEQKVVLVMSKTAAKRYCWESFIGELQSGGNLLWIQENITYPTQSNLLMGLERMREFDADVIIAIGGGSSIDFAKGLKAFGGVKKECTKEVITNCLLKKEIIPGEKNIRIIAVPTTAGTGAELTQWATIWDEQKKCKYSIDHEILKPDKAIIIPEFTLYANEKLTIATGLDALSHAMEAYWSKKSNMLVRSLARDAVHLIVEYLPRVKEQPNELKYREKLCLASVLAGLAFSMTRTTACHSISYPLTMHYGILHGVAVAMTLAQVAERNSGHYAEEEELLELFREYGSIKAYLQDVCGNKVALTLESYHIKKEELETIANHSFTLGRMNNNPVDLNVTDVKQILEEIYTGC